MDEYIKREDALDAVLFALVGTGYQSRAILAVRDVPTADVVPRAEVEATIHKFAERLKTYYKTLKGDTLSSMVVYQIEQIEKDMIGDRI